MSEAEPAVDPAYPFPQVPTIHEESQREISTGERFDVAASSLKPVQ